MDDSSGIVCVSGVIDPSCFDLAIRFIVLSLEKQNHERWDPMEAGTGKT